MGLESGPKGPPKQEWKCRHCGKINAPKSSTCSNCSKPKN